MSQNDFVIADANATATKTDLNNAFQALASQNSGNSAPSTTYANMIWYETDTNLLKMRNEANSGWLKIGYLNQSGEFEVLDDTNVVNTSGTVKGIIGDQSTGTWETGTGTTETLVSPAKVAAAIAALAPVGGWTFVETLSGTTSPMTSSAFADGFEYRAVGFDIRPSGGLLRYIYFDVQKDSDDSWISGVDTSADNQKGMLTQNSMDDTDYAQIALDVVDPRISRVNHQIIIQSTSVHGVSLASLSDDFSTGAGASNSNMDGRVQTVNFSSADKIKAIRFKSSSSAFGTGGTINIYKRPISHA